MPSMLSQNPRPHCSRLPIPKGAEQMIGAIHGILAGAAVHAKEKRPCKMDRHETLSQGGQLS
jgi:hypothetical protein